MRRTLATLRLVCLMLFAAAVLSAQTGNGQIGGVVQDASRALIPGVTVTLTNPDTGVITTQVTNETGVYNFASVPFGTLPAATNRRKNSVRPARCSYDRP